MESCDFKPRKGKDTYRIGHSDDLVLMENAGISPPEKFCIDNYGVIVICTQGLAQFDYDGMVVLLQKNDLFLYMAHSMVTKYMSSPDFNCKLIWFTRSELWNINIFSKTTIVDMSHLKLHPVVHLSDQDSALLDNYFQLLCSRMADPSPVLYQDIVRSLFSTMLLEVLSMMRHTIKLELEPLEDAMAFSLHKKQLVDKFINLVEQSDGRIRRVDEFASQLNITPKYLSTILKEVMNRRPSVYIQLFTMKAIERRLRFTDMTMQEIANDLNFPNPSFFGKYFKEHTGITPMEYRMKYQLGD